MKVVFLDYDGVVNTIMWDEEGKRATFGFPRDNKVNDPQAVQWVSEFCEKFGYVIVVTSTWRLHDNWAMCLNNAGLRKSVKIYDRLPIDPESRNKSRGQLINEYLQKHPRIDRFIILDDDEVEGQIMGYIDENGPRDYGKHNLKDLLIKCPCSTGFKCHEFELARSLHCALNPDTILKDGLA